MLPDELVYGSLQLYVSKRMNFPLFQPSKSTYSSASPDTDFLFSILSTYLLFFFPKVLVIVRTTGPFPPRFMSKGTGWAPSPFCPLYWRLFLYGMASV